VLPRKCGCQALKIVQKKYCTISRLLARPERFERPTLRFVVCCSSLGGTEWDILDLEKLVILLACDPS